MQLAAKRFSDTGELSPSSGSIGPRLTLAGFLESPLATGARALGGWASWSSFELTRQLICGAHFSATLRFQGERLALVNLALIEELASGEDWDEAVALAKRGRHDAWLAACLGPPPYRYLWGTVESVYDPRSVSSSIGVTYLE